MAIVTQKKEDERYAHLEKVYADAKIKKSKKKKEKKVNFKVEESGLKKEDIINYLIVFILFLFLGASGYILSLILK